MQYTILSELSDFSCHLPLFFLLRHSLHLFAVVSTATYFPQAADPYFDRIFFLPFSCMFEILDPIAPFDNFNNMLLLF